MKPALALLAFLITPLLENHRVNTREETSLNKETLALHAYCCDFLEAYNAAGYQQAEQKKIVDSEVKKAFSGTEDPNPHPIAALYCAVFSAHTRNPDETRWAASCQALARKLSDTYEKQIRDITSRSDKALTKRMQLRDCLDSLRSHFMTSFPESALAKEMYRKECNHQRLLRMDI